MRKSTNKWIVAFGELVVITNLVWLLLWLYLIVESASDHMAGVTYHSNPPSQISVMFTIAMLSWIFFSNSIYSIVRLVMDYMAKKEDEDDRDGN